MSVRRLLTSLTAASVLAGASVAANAALVRIDFTGTNSSPGAANVFGTPVTDLTGYLIFDDAVAGSVFSSTATNYSGAIRTLSFSIGSGGNTVFSGLLTGSSYGSAQVQNAAGADRLSFNNLILSATQLQGEVAQVTNGAAVRTFNNAQATLGLSGVASAIANQMLAGIDPSDFTTQRNLQIFLSYTQQGTATAPWPAVSFNYNLQTLAVTPVPLPAAAWLLGSALLPIAGVMRRRRRAA
jgi:hypothetical protein